MDIRTRATGVVRTFLNTFNYRLGDQVNLTTWLSRRWNERISTSAQIDYQINENIVGADKRLNQALVQTNVPQSAGLSANQPAVRHQLLTARWSVPGTASRSKPASRSTNGLMAHNSARLDHQYRLEHDLVIGCPNSFGNPRLGGSYGRIFWRICPPVAIDAFVAGELR